MKTIADVPMTRVWEGQQAALMRLQLYMIGRTHEMLSELAKAIRDSALRHANGEGKLDGLGLYRARSEIETAWKQTFDDWKQEIEGMKYEAATIPFGSLVRIHNEQISNLKSQMESRLQEQEGEGPTFVFSPQVKAVVDAANRRVYGDGLNWSGRVWNLDRESLAGIQREVFAGVANGDSAWDIAKRIEGYLGAGNECPRWTSTRLYSLTKKDIASGDRTGLYSGDECAGQGVAYKALRLARNEIQIAHHLATDMVMEIMPWVEQEQIVLSPAHPVVDLCDDVVMGGERGDGVYEKGEISLPLHPQCLCFKIAVMMERDAFVDRLRDWMNGSGNWAEMDRYAGQLGMDVTSQGGNWTLPALGVGPATSYVTWLWGGEEALAAAVKRAVQLGLGLGE